MPDLTTTGWDMNDPIRALSAFFKTLPEPPHLLALGEPNHTEEAYPLWRNRVFQVLVEQHGFRSIALETDALLGLRVNAHITTGEGHFEDIMEYGFSHEFGQIPANRALIEWMGHHNAGRDEKDRVHFYGFDAPTESMWAPSPRHALLVLHDHLSTFLTDLTIEKSTIEQLCGEDTQWTNPAAAMDSMQSVGATEEAKQLRWLADELLTLLETEGQRLELEPEAFWHAQLHARAAQGLLRYHAIMADPTPHRLARLLTLRDSMMADNLCSIAEREKPRGPTLVFAHNQHLGHRINHWKRGALSLTWCPAGKHVKDRLGARYRFIATTSGQPEATAAHATRDELKPTLYSTSSLLPFLMDSSSGTMGTNTTPDSFSVKPQFLQHTDGVLLVPISQESSIDSRR